MSILAVDAGNTRIKWACHARGAWQEQGWTPTANPQLQAQWAELSAPNKIVVSNVAGTSIEQAIASAIQHWGIQPLYVRAQPSQCGISNGYNEAERLGSDRWAALIAAHHLHPGRDLLVVQAGTAVTIDTLSGQGQFRGGMIVPGLGLMQDALAQSTAGLERLDGKICPFPCSTADAMMSGAANAIAGAVERGFRQLATRSLCLISGGDADILLPLLNIPVQKADQLVLEGLLRIALET
ncbi:MAG: type III pantothenate kinase [Gammaproteobacteria bacterium]|nr:type III pantothenate kinase [Gammaproteobacteria bacterium]MBU1731680.1 type III pantothenate kinase [Gammaproteobacteria bacterium]MBU1892504.1 type III pantothenate kinase [Gammaproteobacteria bacterium]